MQSQWDSGSYGRRATSIRQQMLVALLPNVCCDQGARGRRADRNGGREGKSLLSETMDFIIHRPEEPVQKVVGVMRKAKLPNKVGKKSKYDHLL